ncbi:MAG: hypothetical protein L6300_03110, partial [Syntrophaceae bacterium]|nr:hypothetical protein [Syntrophaceae bacterium]
ITPASLVEIFYPIQPYIPCFASIFQRNHFFPPLGYGAHNQGRSRSLGSINNQSLFHIIYLIADVPLFSLIHKIFSDFLHLTPSPDAKAIRHAYKIKQGEKLKP